MKSVICPGTFDPITLGHENMIRRAAALFDCVYVAVLDNIDKKTVFTMNERMHFAESVFDDDNRIKVIESKGLLSDVAKQLGVSAILKGARDATDFDYEKELFLINNALVPGLDTVILPAMGDLSFISSTAVRDIGRHGGDISGFVNSRIIDKVKTKLNC